jgi:hypothetical protein
MCAVSLLSPDMYIGRRELVDGWIGYNYIVAAMEMV